MSQRNTQRVLLSASQEDRAPVSSDDQVERLVTIAVVAYALALLFNGVGLGAEIPS